MKITKKLPFFAWFLLLATFLYLTTVIVKMPNRLEKKLDRFLEALEQSNGGQGQYLTCTSELITYYKTGPKGSYIETVEVSTARKKYHFQRLVCQSSTGIKKSNWVYQQLSWQAKENVRTALNQGEQELKNKSKR